MNRPFVSLFVFFTPRVPLVMKRRERLVDNNSFLVLVLLPPDCRELSASCTQPEHRVTETRQQTLVPNKESAAGGRDGGPT